MARQSLPSFDDLWAKHEEIYIEVFLRALSELVSRSSVKGNEDVISESMVPIICKICYEMGQSSRREIRRPTWEGPRQPVNKGELKCGKQTRPDFTCSIYNVNACTPEEHEIYFHIECKRLGKPTSRNWHLCENYVKRGIARFDSTTHEYGKRAVSGMMIGYIISMTPKQVQKAVNDYKRQTMNHVPDICFKWKKNSKVCSTRSKFARLHVIPSQFSLTHIWADIRKNYRHK